MLLIVLTILLAWPVVAIVVALAVGRTIELSKRGIAPAAGVASREQFTSAA